jgi:hypothetical protein
LPHAVYTRGKCMIFRAKPTVCFIDLGKLNLLMVVLF